MKHDLSKSSSYLYYWHIFFFNLLASKINLQLSHIVVEISRSSGHNGKRGNLGHLARENCVGKRGVLLITIGITSCPEYLSGRRCETEGMIWKACVVREVITAVPAVINSLMQNNITFSECSYRDRRDVPRHAISSTAKYVLTRLLFTTNNTKRQSWIDSTFQKARKDRWNAGTIYVTSLIKAFFLLWYIRFGSQFCQSFVLSSSLPLPFRDDMRLIFDK